MCNPSFKHFDALKIYFIKRHLVAEEKKVKSAHEPSGPSSGSLP